MSGYKNFAVVGAGTIGKYIVQQLLKDKAAGIVNDVVVLTREVKYPSNNCYT
jgi:saccharopine dehydrogenase-like NADP-dependent oxidoreductase